MIENFENFKIEFNKKIKNEMENFEKLEKLEYNKLILEISLNIKAMGKPSLNPKFRDEISNIIRKYYPNWKAISYEFRVG